MFSFYIRFQMFPPLRGFDESVVFSYLSLASLVISWVLSFGKGYLSEVSVGWCRTMGFYYDGVEAHLFFGEQRALASRIEASS